MRKKAHTKNGKFMSLLLAVLMICSILPIQAYALGTDPSLVVTEERTADNSAASISEEERTSDDSSNADEGEINALTGEETSDEQAGLVAFDPDDGKTGYNDFFKVTVPIGSTVTDQPENPTRDGYIFKAGMPILMKMIIWFSGTLKPTPCKTTRLCGPRGKKPV